MDWLNREGKSFLFLTNSSERSPVNCSQKLARMGLDVSEDHFYTSALATAALPQEPVRRLHGLRHRCTRLLNALYDAGITNERR